MNSKKCIDLIRKEIVWHKKRLATPKGSYPTKEQKEFFIRGLEQAEGILISAEKIWAYK